MPRLLLLELNEVNFDFVRRYAADGVLPNFHSFLSTYGWTETESEVEYAHLEPWIQWVTAHTGLSFAEHGVFRLGDIVDRDIPQIWEQLEARGLKVAAMSPMNAKARVRNPAFFVPDPWTPTEVIGPPAIRSLHAAIAQAVNDNADARMTPGSALTIGIATLKAMTLSNAGAYLGTVAKAKGRPWFRAMFLDRLLTDLFADSVEKAKPDFASLFLNAAAHIQHHYMFSSPHYQGPFRNPDWYVGADEDPLLDVYRLYDDVLGQLLSRFPGTRILLATGLHQDPYPDMVFYWRLVDHAGFLTSAGVPHQSVEPRMSRDFVIRCVDASQAATAETRLGQIMSEDRIPLFTVDNRGTDLFVELTYPHDVPSGARYLVGNELRPDLRAALAFVAIKNGGHNGIGYFADSGARLTPEDRFPLKELPKRIEAMLGLDAGGGKASVARSTSA